MTLIVIIYHILSCAGAILLLGGAALIFRRARLNKTHARSLYALVFLLAVWGLTFLVASLDLSSMLAVDYQPLSPAVLVTGNMYVIICLLYPLELAQPGWINPRRVLLLMAPYVAITLFYFIVTLLLGQPLRELYNIPDILVHIGEFNVWFRFVLYLLVCMYIAYLLSATIIERLDKRKEAGYGPEERYRDRWLLIYGIGMCLIVAAYFLLLIYNTTSCLVVHRVVTICFFTLIACEAIFGSDYSKKP